jgi:DNA-binding transcriptional regulator YiaG
MASRARKLSKSVHSAEQAVFCAAMIAARKGAGLTQQQLAQRLRKPQSFVAKYEGGERRLDVVEFLGVTPAIGADPMQILRDMVKLRADRGA